MGEKLKVTAEWDDEASVWVAQSDDVPGLITEAKSMEALIQKLKVMVPEMLEENGVARGREAQIPFELQTTCTVTQESRAN